MRKTVYALAAFGMVLTAQAQAAPVNLSGWLAEGNGNWVLQGGNNSVLQTLNNNPTVFYNNADSQGMSLSGQITVQSSGDDDFIGFVLGYQAGGVTAGSGAQDFLLVDWKQSDQGGFFGGTAQAGLAISHVTAPLQESAGAWLHDSSDGVTELQRATNLGSTGWADNTTYDFKIAFTAALVEIFVNGTKELSVASSLIGSAFANGSFGFYNYSQANVLYAGITEDVLPPVSAVPVPAALPLLASGMAGLGFIGWRRNRKQRAA